MKDFIRFAALAALMTAGAASAQDQYPPAQQPEGSQTPTQTTPDPSQDPSTTAPPSSDPSTQATGGEWPEFSSLDTNGDGSLSEDEAKAQSLLASRFGEVDADKNGALSQEEYDAAQDLYQAPQQ